ncbi:MAG TPA: hypothetical protein VGK46_09915, partial [Saprospiraceae bacterium]
EKYFPGELEVIENVVDLDLKNLYYKKKTSIVADKKDPEVQIAVTWFKEQDGLGITVDEVKTALDGSKRDILAARNLFKALSEKGLAKFSVGVIDMAAYILLFEEPVPSLRKDYLGKILHTLDALPDHEQTSIWIECMEPASYQEHFKDIIPFGYWKRGGTYHEDKKIMSLDFEWKEGLEVDVLNTGWAINSNSQRSTGYREDAYKAALAWAEKNLPSPFYLEADQMVAIGPDDEDPLALTFDFPYYESKPDTTVLDYEDNALGYVNGVYHTEKKTFTKIKKVKEL